MKHMLKSTLIMVLSFMSTMVASAAENPYLLKCGDITMTVDAEHGGKILSLKYQDKEMLSQSRWPESFGSTFWTSPQKEWNWPPVPEFDKQAYSVEQAECTPDGSSVSLLSIHSQPSARLGLSVGKKFSVDKAGGGFVVTYTIKNEGSEPRQVAPWEISRVPNTDGVIFFQAAGDSVWPSGLLSFQKAHNAMWYTPDEAPQNRKVNADGKGWLAYCANGLLMLKTFTDLQPGDEAPGEAEIQVYVNRGKSYIELESQGAYAMLKPGSQLSWTVRWQLIPVDAASQKPDKLIKLVQKFTQHPSPNTHHPTPMTSSSPLLLTSTLPYGAPDFSKIKPTDYLPAIEAAIQQQREEVNQIVANKKKPTFENTILAYEQSGIALDRVTSIFYALVSADKTPVIAETEKKVTPLLTELENEITFNKGLFQRIKYVYEHQYKSLKGEDKKLLEETYKAFVRSGALLSDEKMARMKEINMRIADLQQQWGDLLPSATNNSVVWVNSKEELAGLSDADIAQCEKDAKNQGAKTPYCIVVINTTQQPILTSLENRQLRKRVYEASIHRADGSRSFNTLPLVVEIARLRAEKAELMGYKNYASLSLEKTMAKTPEQVDAFLKQLISQYAPKANEETKAIEAYARQTEGADFNLQPYDRFYYSAKMKKAAYNFSEEEVKPYFNIDSVLVNGVFYAAHRVYGLQFKERKDIPVYHPDMKVYEVIDKDGKTLALFYNDYFRRPTKRGGAWMSSFAKQSNLRKQIPLIFNVCNNAKAPEGQPSLLTWDEVTTLFHEFGHALHGILSNCKYNALSGTAVARDFVELPSQFNEFFASVPEIFDHYAKHAVTGQRMPADLKEKMLNSINFQPAYALGENLAATCLDLEWHKLTKEQIPTAQNASAFETAALKSVGMYDEQIPPRYSTSYFNHVWGGGYAAGYYSYLWTEVLADNVADYFRAHGPLKPEVGQALRDKILSRGNTKNLMEMFTDFTGMKSPDTSSLLKARGF